MDPLRKVKAGDPLSIPAPAWNTLIDTARALRSGEHDLLAGRAPHAVGQIKVKNTSGAARGRFSILGLDTPIITPTGNLLEFKQQPQFKGVTPTASHTGKFCVLLESLPNNATGRAVISGVAVCQIDVVHASHRYADVLDATKLQSSHAGSAEILWKDSGTGDKWAIVRLGPYSPGLVLCKLEANWNKASQTTGLEVWIGTPGSEVDSGLTITAYNRFANLTASAGSPVWVWCAWNGFGWYATAAECV